MRRPTLAALSVLGLLGSVAPASAQSCYDLWYERNAIYDAYGYCFTSRLGRETFNNSDCYTKHVDLSPDDQYRVDMIQREERRRGCKVN